MERLSKQLTMALAMVLLCAGSASAEAVCTNDPDEHLYICHNTFGTLTGNTTAAVPLPKFDSTLGRLTQVDFYLNSHIAGSATLTNHNSTLEYYKVTLREYVTFTDPNNVLVAYTIPIFVSPEIFPVPQPGAVSVAAKSTGTVTGSADASAPGITTMTAAADLARYIGSGDLNFTVRTQGNSIFEGATSTDFTSSISTSGSADVIYRYVLNEVPEPTTMFLIGSSLLLIGLTRRAKTLSA